jgi:hypothetical protein
LFGGAETASRAQVLQPNVAKLCRDALPLSHSPSINFHKKNSRLIIGGISFNIR